MTGDPARPRVLVVEDNPTVRAFAVRALLGAGWDVHVAADAREGAARAAALAPHVVVVDATLPDGDGETLCRDLAATAPRAGLVLTAAAAARVGPDEVVAAAADRGLAKPFAPNALVEAVRAAHRGAAPAGTPAAAGVPERLADMERAEALEAGVAVVVDALAAALAAVEADGAAFADALRAHVGLEELLGLGRRLRALTPGEAGSASFEGRLDHLSLADVLQVLEQTRQSGVLELWDDLRGRALELCLRGGRLDAVVVRELSTDVFRLGRFLEREGVAFEDALETQPSGFADQSGRFEIRRLGRRLVRAGLADEETVRRAIARQAEALVYDAFRWPEARFRFARFATRPEAAEARLGLSLAPLTMEGVKRADEWRDALERVGGLGQRLRREEGPAPDAAPRDPEWLARLDLPRTVAELLEQAPGGDPLEALRTLLRHVEARRLVPTA